MIRIWGSFHTDICFVASQCFLQRGQYLRNEINHDDTSTQHDRVWCPHTCTYKCVLNLRGPIALNFQSATAKFIQFYIYQLKEIWEGWSQILMWSISLKWPYEHLPSVFLSQWFRFSKSLQTLFQSEIIREAFAITNVSCWCWVKSKILPREE